MRFNYYRIIYFNIILLFLFLFNQFFLFFLIFFFKIPYLLNAESDIDYQFNFQTSTIEDVGSAYLENDIDNDFFYTLQHMQSYLYSNCRFFFDVLGGETTLDYIDFIDFTIYKINDRINDVNRNYKYIYNNEVILKNSKFFNNLKMYKIYQIIEEAKSDNNTKHNLNYLQNILNAKLYNNDNKQQNEKFTNKLKRIQDNNLIDKQIIIQQELLKKNKKKNKVYMYQEIIRNKVKDKLYQINHLLINKRRF